MNEAVEFASELLKANEHVQVLWQIGKLYMRQFADSTASAQLSNVHAFEFLTKMDYAYAVADLVVARAGALTISEVCVAGVQVILVPSPHVEDHQTKNAESLRSVGAAILIKDSEAKESLLTEALDLLDNPQQLQALRSEITKLARPSATADIVKVIKKEVNAK